MDLFSHCTIHCVNLKKGCTIIDYSLNHLYTRPISLVYLFSLYYAILYFVVYSLLNRSMPLCQRQRFELLYYSYETLRKLKITVYCMQLWNCLSSRSIDSSKEIEMIKTLKEHSKQLDHLATTVPKVFPFHRISITHKYIWNLIYTFFSGYS